MTPELTDDAFLGGLVRVRQPVKGYRAGVDAVLLAASVSCAKPDGSPQPNAAPNRESRPCRVLDVGAGVGTVGLCLAARLPWLDVVLMEREPVLAVIARANVEANNLEHRVTVTTAAVEAAPLELGLAGLDDASFDHVVANPPFHDTGSGSPAPDPLKAQSHAMPGGDLDAWVRFMARMAKPSGRATLIHKADALGQLLAAMRGRFGGLIIQPVHPRVSSPAVRVIIQGTKGSRAPLTLRPGFVLHGEANAFLPEADAIFRTGAALPLTGHTPQSTAIESRRARG